jgi:hypothetical protein
VIDKQVGQWEAAGNAFGRGDEIGHDRLMIAGKPGTGSAKTGLNLIGNKHCAVGPSEVRNCGQESSRRNDKAALALDGLYHDGGHVVVGGLGGTYGGNPVSCAAALGAIATMEEMDLAAAARGGHAQAAAGAAGALSVHW